MERCHGVIGSANSIILDPKSGSIGSIDDISFSTPLATVLATPGFCTADNSFEFRANVHYGSSSTFLTSTHDLFTANDSHDTTSRTNQA